MNRRQRRSRFTGRQRAQLALAALTSLTSLTLSTSLTAVVLENRDTGAPVTCAEDQPCWDWRTMGNERRGVCVDGRWQLEHADGTITNDNPLDAITKAEDGEFTIFDEQGQRAGLTFTFDGHAEDVIYR